MTQKHPLFFAIFIFRPPSCSPVRTQVGLDPYFSFSFFIFLFAPTARANMTFMSISSLESSSFSSIVKQQLVRQNSSRGVSTSSRQSEPSHRITTPSIRRDGLEGNRFDFLTSHPVFNKEYIPLACSLADLLFLKEELKFPNLVVIFEPNEMEREDSLLTRWVCFYKITFRICIQLPLHPFMTMILDHF